MRIWIFTTIINLFIIPSIYSQSPIYNGQEVLYKNNPYLTEQFKAYHVYEIDSKALNRQAKSGHIDIDFVLALGNEFNWHFSITPHDIRSDDYVLRAQTETGIVSLPRSENKTFRGSLQGNVHSVVALTLDEELIYGFIKVIDTYHFIEPLWYFDPNAPRDLFVVYDAKDVIPKEGKLCGALEMANHKHDHSPKGTTPPAKSLLCYELELAIASDDAMFTSYGSVAAVEAHNVGVMNNVETDFDDPFNHEITYNIIEQFVVTDGNNPWPAGTGNPNAGDYLDDFRIWGEGGGFMNDDYDLGQLWTDLDLQGSTIGVAWLGVLCESFRYHLLQDFSTNANLLRVLTSHEIGHNFNSGHDGGGGFIMSPSVSNTNVWSAQSISSINNHITNKINSGCLELCSDPVPPTAAFSFSDPLICTGSMVTLIDESINDPTNWSWSMPGATPSSSTAQFPTISYPNPGTYTVTLLVSNGFGSNSISQSITVGAGTDFFHFTDFETGMNGWTIENPNNNVTWTAGTINSSRFGNAVMWIDNYNNDLDDQRDALVSPTLDFAGRTTINLQIDYAYARYNNNFRDSMVVYVSTDNGVSYTRVFADTENGSGNFASAPQTTAPFVPGVGDWCFDSNFGPGCLNLDISAFAGSSTARVKIENVNGYGNQMYVDNIKITSDCQILLPPIANFSASPQFGCAPLAVFFEDLSLNGANSWNWIFPGGTPPSSTDQNPIIVYNNEGVYDVTLTVFNSAGSNTLTFPMFVNVDDVAEANFDYTNDELTFNFNNTTTGNYTDITWEFGDGNFSNEENPVYTYAEDGVYDVTLSVTNVCGTTITQQTVEAISAPVAGFSADQTTGCPPFFVTFNDESTSNTTSWNWSFPGGNPSSSTEQYPTVEYNVPGNYDVTLEASNSAGTDTYTEFFYIEVGDTPVADFSFIADLNNVSFFNSSTNATSYFWDFGDGNSSTEVDPFHSYEEDGTYTVILEATNECGTETFTNFITILTPPAFAAFSSSETSGCLPFTVNFFDLSPSNVTGWIWTFEGGTPNSSIIQNPVITYEEAGTYNVSLTVLNAAGQASTTQNGYITVNDIPNANFVNSINNFDVNFFNNSTNALSYSWEFGDGSTSVEPNPQHTYDMDGTYTVTLIAQNPCGTDTYQETITILTAPIAGFSAPVTEGCADFTVQFMDESTTNATSWLWIFEGGSPGSSMEQNPIVTYSQAGSYDVTLTVSNAAGESTSSQAAYIVVADVPIVDFESMIDEDFASFTNSSQNANSYQWDFGDGNMSTEENPNHTYEVDGTYFVTLTAMNDCGANSFTERITISTLPVAGFNADNTVGCASFTVQFMDQSSENTTGWNWFFPGGIPENSNEQNPVVVYELAGTYDVTLIASNESGENSVSQTSYIIVNDIPSAEFLVNIDGSNANFTNNSVGATSYLWDFGDGNMSSEVEPVHTYEMDGTYTITLTSTNECGSTTMTMEVTILTPPSAAFTSSQTVGCLPFTVQFTDASSTNTVEWNWTFEGGIPATSNEQNPSVVYENAGTYNVTLEVTNAAGGDTFVQTDLITINDIPNPGFSQTIDNFDVDFTNNSDGATSYNWEFGDGNMSTDENPNHTYEEDGVYTVTLTAINECGSASTTQEITIITPPQAGFTSDITFGCAPLTVQFMDASSLNATSWNWTFEGGMPESSTEQNPIVVFENEGSYAVTLQVSNAAGSNTLIQSNLIVVNDVPNASFNSGVIGSDLTLINTSTNADSYSWDFGDGNMSTMGSPTHTYEEDGTYTVSLTATNECGSVTTTEVITIATPPTAGFSTMTQSGCAPFEVQFINLSSNNSESFSWTFEGGNPSTSNDPNPIVTYEEAGIFDVSLTVTNSVGESTSSEMSFIQVGTTPEIDFTSSVLDATATFTNNTMNATSYHWNFGDGNESTEENPVHTYEADDAYNVTLTATNECGESVFSQLVVIATMAPIAAFTTESTIGCPPFDVQFENLSSATAEFFNWTFEGGTPENSNEENPIVTYSQPGTYTVTLEAGNGIGSDLFTIENYIEILPIASANFNFEVDETIVTFTNTSLDGTTYEWDFGDDTSSDEVNPTHEYDQAGTYLVTLTVTNSCGSVSISQEVEITAIAPTAFFNADVQEDCVPFTVNFEDTSFGNPTAWNWTFEGGDPATSTEQNPVVTYTDAGVYDVSLEVSSSVGSNTFIGLTYIVANDIPTPSFEYDQTDLQVNFTNTSQLGDLYFWEFGDGNTSILENPSHVYEEAGTYTVVLTVTNDCGAATFTRELTIVVNSINEIPGLEVFNLYPNPNDGHFTLALDGDGIKELDLAIYNIIGQKLVEDVLDFSGGHLRKDFNLSEFATGVYVMQISNNNKSIYKRIIIE